MMEFPKPLKNISSVTIVSKLPHAMVYQDTSFYQKVHPHILKGWMEVGNQGTFSADSQYLSFFLT